MRETQSDDTLKLWVLSTNKPSHILAIFWVVMGLYFIVFGIIVSFILPYVPIFPPPDLILRFFSTGFGVYFISGAVFLFYDSQSIHNDPLVHRFVNTLQYKKMVDTTSSISAIDFLLDKKPIFMTKYSFLNDHFFTGRFAHKSRGDFSFFTITRGKDTCFTGR